MLKRNHNRWLALLGTLILGLVLACGGGGGGGGGGTPAPVISSFSPNSGAIGDIVAITGSNLSGASAVKFGSVDASLFSSASSTQVSVVVPSGAASGTISVTTPGGTAVSSDTFTYYPLPTISALSTANGKAGDSVIITGTNFTSNCSVSFGSGIATNRTVNSTTQITAVIPESATTGAVTVSTPGGTAVSALTFTVNLTISGFNPTQGPVGTLVIIKGAGFTSSSTVTFNGKASTSVSFVSSNELDATVPIGATTGIISLANGGSPLSSTTSFTVTVGSTALDLFVDGWYLTQSTQTYTGVVPLVASRDGLLRVFVRANQANVVTPAVSVTINGNSVDVAAPSGVTTTTGVPTSINEGDLTKSWNLSVPGASIHAGMTISIQVDPTSAITEADKTNNAASGAPTVNTANPFNCVIVPVKQGGLTGRVGTATSWLDRFQRMYPIQNGGVSVSTGATYTFTGTLSSDGTGWETLLGELANKRTVDHSSSYYFGAVNVSYASGVAGLGYVGYPVALGWDKTGYSDGGNYPEVFAHEVGHNFGREHSPCGDPSGVDPNYPYANGSIGVWGWDYGYASASSPLNVSPLRNPAAYADIMAYCSPLWVSDYTYQGIMTFRANSSIGDVVQASQVQQDCLLVSGRVVNGQVILDPAFKVRTVPSRPVPGSYSLQLQDANGAAVSEATFEPVEIADLPNQSVRHFSFALPLDSSVEAATATLRVMKDGALKAVMAPSGASVRLSNGAAAMFVREPVSVRMWPGQAHLSWDSSVYPKVMVRDPRTGEVLSFADGGSLDVETDATALDVTFSDGVHSAQKLLPVQ